MNGPTENITELLLHIARSRKITKKFSGFDGSIKTVYNIDHVGQMMIKNFFDGHLGKAMFDDIYLDDNENDKDLELDRFV